MAKNLVVGKIRKSFNKVHFSKVRYFLVNNEYFLKLFKSIESVSKRSRRYLLRKLSKERLVLNFRSLVISDLAKTRKFSNEIIDPLHKFFFKFQYPVIRSMMYYNITDMQLELIRRLARRFFGKHIYVRIMIGAYKTLLRRTNQVRMGGGKGSKLYKKVYPLVPGSSILEIRGFISSTLLFRFFKGVQKKLPFKLSLVFLNRI